MGIRNCPYFSHEGRRSAIMPQRPEVLELLRSVPTTALVTQLEPFEPLLDWLSSVKDGSIILTVAVDRTGYEFFINEPPTAKDEKE